MKAELKKMAKNGQHTAAKMIAKDLTRVKVQSEKMTQFTGQLKAVSLRIGALSTLNEMSDAMEQAANAMTLVSNKLDTNRLMTLNREMALGGEKLEMKSELVS